MGTKKILAPFDFSTPERLIRGTLLPVVDNNISTSLVELGTGRIWKAGLVVFVGRELTKDDVFTKLVNSGRKIDSVERQLAGIESYLNQMNHFKIGDVLGLNSETDGSFQLVRLEKPERKASKLP